MHLRGRIDSEASFIRIVRREEAQHKAILALEVVIKRYGFASFLLGFTVLIECFFMLQEQIAFHD